MLRSLPDIECFEVKVTQIFKEAQRTRSGLFDIASLGRKIGLDKDEIEAMHYHLKRSDMIEQAEGSLLRISKYGHMLQKGQINHGYLPI